MPEVFAAEGDHVFVYVRCALWAHGATEAFETVAVDVWNLRDGKLLAMKTFYEDTAESIRRLHAGTATSA